jgi:hypothetical protein
MEAPARRGWSQWSRLWTGVTASAVVCSERVRVPMNCLLCEGEHACGGGAGAPCPSCNVSEPSEASRPPEGPRRI